VAAAVGIDIDDVRAVGRSTRAGYRLDASTTSGDSGAGVYIDDVLIGVVFAASAEDFSITWVTTAGEVAAFLDDETRRGTFTCDPEESLVVRRRHDLATATGAGP